MTPSSSALEPAGVQAHRIAELLDGFVYVALAVFAIMIVAFVAAFVARKALSPKHATRGVAVAIGVTVLVLIGLLFMSVRTSRALASLGAGEAPITIEVVGRKWWWEFRYPAELGGLQFTTAYELHIPVGRPIELRLASYDVIHSFWVPSLDGKRDLIPGKDTTLILRADHAGRYQGLCAEFCGVQHANMRFVVVAETEEEFRRWLAHSLEPAATPSEPKLARGAGLFMTTRCATCHAIAGTEAFATVGPDLTHVASRSDLAMGALPNDPNDLARWIQNPQHVKPGTQMPPASLPPEDLDALVAYLGSLR